MKKWEIATKIRYTLGLNDRAEDILMKLTETDLMTLAEMVQDRPNGVCNCNRTNCEIC